MGLEPHMWPGNQLGTNSAPGFCILNISAIFFCQKKKVGNRDKADISLWHPNEVLSVPSLLQMTVPFFFLREFSLHAASPDTSGATSKG